MKLLGVLFCVLGFANFALADESPAKTENTDKSEQDKGAPIEPEKTPQPTKETETPASPKPDYAGLILPMGRIGPSVSLLSPHIYNIALDVRLWNKLGLSFEYGPGFEFEFLLSTIKMSHWSFNAQWFPWAGTFFVGGKIGSQTLEAKLNSDVEALGQTRDVTATAKLDTFYFAPYLGWHAMWGGFLLGSDLGVIIPISSKAKLDANVKSASAAENDAAKDTDDYKETLSDAEDAAEALGKKILPYATLIKIGYLF